MILEEDGVVSLRSGQAVGSFRFPAPTYLRCFTEEFPFVKHTRVLDLAGSLTRQASRLLYAWPKIDTVRVLPSCTVTPDIPTAPSRAVYFDPDDITTIGHGARRVVVHLRRPAESIEWRLDLGVKCVSELVIVLHRWESKPAEGPAPENDYELHEYIQRAMWDELGHLNAFLCQADATACEGLTDDGEEDPYAFQQEITIIGLERMDPATFGLRPEWIAGRWFDEIMSNYIFNKYSGHYWPEFRTVEGHWDRVGQRGFEIEMEEELLWGKPEEPEPWHEVVE